MGKVEHNKIRVEVILHCNRESYFYELILSEEFESFVRAIDLWVEQGYLVESFQGVNTMNVTMIFRFDCRRAMERYCRREESFSS